MNSYGREYYLKNKEYLLQYQKWYMLKKKLELGIINEDMMIEKPKLNKKKYERKMEDRKPKIIRGKFIISFD